jgi:hypothetical protein
MMGTNHYLTRVASGEDSSIFIASAGNGKTRSALFLSFPKLIAAIPPLRFNCGQGSAAVNDSRVKITSPVAVFF